MENKKELLIEKPRVLVSKCLGFCNCRYDGSVIPNDFVEKIKPYVEFIQVCPEVEIGLGVPRDTIRMVLIDGEYELYQPSEDRIVTPEMDKYSHKVLSSISDIEGAILKGRSPTCGIKDVKKYQSLKKGASSIKGVGIFAEHLYNYFPYASIEEEGRLTNLNIREHFLIKLFTNYRFKNIEEDSMKELVEFHTRHKYLLMAYNQLDLKTLGGIVANHKKLPYEEVIKNYKERLGIAMENPPKIGDLINTLMHILGYFSEDLRSEEKSFIIDNFTMLKENKIHSSVPINILRSYAIKYKQDYILDQYLWEPFPSELLNIQDSGK